MERRAGAARVSAVRPLRGGRVQVVLDDGRIFLLAEGDSAGRDIRPGAAFDDGTHSQPPGTHQPPDIHESALGFLSRRGLSSAELRRRLERRGFDRDAIEAEVERLQRAGLLDDEAFASAWVAERERRAPRSGRLLKAELRQHGIGAESAAAAITGVDDRETAIALARTRARRVHANDFHSFAAKVGGFLQRRGFDHETAMEATRTAWSELGGTDDE